MGTAQILPRVPWDLRGRVGRRGPARDGKMVGVNPVYLARRPAPPLDRYVEELWFRQGAVIDQPETVAPTGSAVGALVLGPPILLTPHSSRPPTPAAWLRGEQRPYRASSSYLLGPHDRPTTVEPTGETHCLGFVTTPIGCLPAAHAAPSAIRGRVVNLLAAWPGAATLRREAETVADPHALLAELERALAADLAPVGHGTDRAERAVAVLAQDPTTPIGDVARAVGLSRRQLDREFARIVGLPPTTLAGILRVRALLAHLGSLGTPDWAARTADLGWAEPERAERDIQRQTGLSPAALAAGPARA